MIAIGITIALYFTSGPAAIAEDKPVRVVRKDIEITVFNEIETEGMPLLMPVEQAARMETQAAQPSAVRQRMVAQGPMHWNPQSATVRSGLMLVKDRRIVMNLETGDNEVRFTDVAASIDPTSVRFVSNTDPLHTHVVEQNFEYDLATAGALLERYLDKPITCIGKSGERYEGYLCAHDDTSIILADGLPNGDGTARTTQTISRDDLAAIRLPTVPGNLHTRPTLVWKIRTQAPGEHDTTLTYLCGHAKWQADYVVAVTPGDRESGDRIDIQGWVTIDNRSGSTYPDAGIKLIAGDVNRVPDPWAPRPPEERLWGLNFRARVAGAPESASYFAKTFEEKSFFEYHLYTLSAPSTVRDRQIKQLKLLRATDVNATRRYVFEPWATSDRVRVVLEFKNEENNRMGMPLPKGDVRLMQRDADGELQFIGQDEIDHTPKDEEVELEIGTAFDVTAEQLGMGRRRPSPNHDVSDMRLRMRNHRDEPINARIIESLGDAAVPDSNWEITKTTDPWTRHDVDTIQFDFVLEPNEEKTILYTVEYRW